MNRITVFRHMKVAAVAATVAVLGCGETENGLVDPLAPQFAKGGAGTAVDAADPPYGKRGETGKNVAILGRGFLPGDQASWELDGAPDPKIAVVATQYVSSTKLIATIDIATDAALRYYDIAVSGPGRKGGIGTQRFEVTTANLLPELIGQNGESGTSVAWGISDAGHIVGRSATQAFFWSVAGGIEDLGMGTAFDVDAAGLKVVGANGLEAGNLPTIWVGGSGAWTSSTLTTSCVGGAVGGLARAISRDGTRAGGQLPILVGNKSKSRPVVWDLANGSCVALPLLAPFNDVGGVVDLAGNDVAVGNANNHPMVWTAGVPALLGLLPGTSTALTRGINDAGTLIVGVNDGRAVYWTRTGSGWSGPSALASVPCQGNAVSWANDVNDAGLIVGQGCDNHAWYWQLTGGGVVSAGRLPGFGQHERQEVLAVNDAPTSGQPSMVGGSPAVYWVRP